MSRLKRFKDTDLGQLASEQRFQWIDDLHASIFGSTWWKGPRIVVSMGGAPVAIPAPREGISPVVNGPTLLDSKPVSGAPVGQSNTPSRYIIPRQPITTAAPSMAVNETLYATTEAQYAKLKAIYPNNPVVYQPAQPTPVQAPVTATKPAGEPVVSDLGNLAIDLLGQAGTAYINQKLGPQPVPVGYSPNLPQMLTDTGVGIPFVDVIPNMPSDCGEYVYKKVCGEYKWVKKRRRRRRPIATNAEIGQVQAISSVLKGDNLKVWLAKRA